MVIDPHKWGVEADRLSEYAGALTYHPQGVGPISAPEHWSDFTPAGGRPAPLLTDFGRRIFAQPLRLYQPATIEELERAANEAVLDGLEISVRGQGHSVDGQTVVDDSALLDLGQLRQVQSVDGAAVTVEAGATWRDVLNATLPLDRAPHVVPDFLGLTVGGTLSMGGISGMSHRYGTSADHVLSATVLDPHGERHWLRQGDSGLDSVLCGQGRNGILSTVTLALREVPSQVRTAVITTQSLTDHLEVQRDLLGAGAVQWMDGGVARRRDGELEFVTRLSLPAGSEGLGLIADVTWGWVAIGDFFARADGAVSQQRAQGTWTNSPHPRVQTILPLDAGRYVVEKLLRRTPSDLLGPGGTVMLYVTSASRLGRLRVRGDDSDLAIVVGWQRTGVLGDPTLAARMHEANRLVNEWTTTAGGVLYPYGGTPSSYSAQAPRDE